MARTPEENVAQAMRHYAKNKAAGTCVMCAKAPAVLNQIRCLPCAGKARCRDLGLSEVEAIKAIAALVAHDGRCACCGRSEPGGHGWQIDHDHKTGKFRGIICVSCNRGLGLFHESVQLLCLGIKYLLRTA